jgi:hypothetical protein
MPPRRTPDADQPGFDDEPDDAQPGTAVDSYVLPEHIRQDLLRTQQESLTTAIQLPKIKVLPAGVGLYEIESAQEGAEPQHAPSFVGVIIAHHNRNILWDRKHGSPAPIDDLLKRPACSSEDGKYGVPREGFTHAALGRPAIRNERIECASCPYNQFGSGAMLVADKNAKGRAVSNYKVLYVMLDGRVAPMELALPGMSIRPFEDYLMRLTNQGVPVMAVFTEFRQSVTMRNGSKVANAEFRRAGVLNEQQFNAVLDKRVQFAASITPQAYIPLATIVQSDESQHDSTGGDESDYPPF